MELNRLLNNQHINNNGNCLLVFKGDIGAV